MKKVFIDLGSNEGQGLRQFINMYNIDENWEIHCYEPTPNLQLDEDLMALPNLQFHNVAVWSKNGKLEFSMCIPDEKWSEASQGSAVMGLLTAAECVDETSPQYRKNDNIVEVKCVDICSILKKYSNDDFILVKMDIEGSEFEVCRKLLRSKQIHKINELYVEWHTRMVGSESPETEKELKESIRSNGITLHDWH